MKLIILDRDGVINEDSDAFIKSPDEWMPIPGSVEAIAQLTKAGYTIVIATNQSGLGRGLFDITTLNAIHQKMLNTIKAAGGAVPVIMFCPHLPTDDCDCRKPRPGMFNTISERFDTELKGVPSVGDSLRDLQAALLAGCTPYLVLTGKGKQTLEKGGLPPGTQVFDSLAAVASHLIEKDQQAVSTTPVQTVPEQKEKPVASENLDKAAPKAKVKAAVKAKQASLADKSQKTAGKKEKNEKKVIPENRKK